MALEIGKRVNPFEWLYDEKRDDKFAGQCNKLASETAQDVR